ncbi:MAG: radical SAM protein [Kiritimatiellia bacterium]|jgi:MoaA/NifB/PqqE/SkfB family radical SAM enzyme
MTATNLKKAPRHAVLELTFHCNQNCIFCYLPWLEDPSMIAPELAIDDWLDIADRLVRHGVRHFTLTGGEPLVKPGVEKLLDFLIAHEAKPAFTIFTNGILVDDALLRKLKGTKGDIACSLPGLRQFAKLTASDHTIYDMIDLFDEMKRAGVGFSVSITVTKPAFREMEDLVGLAAVSGAKCIQVVPFVAEGRGAQHPELMLTYDELQTLGRRVKKLKGKIKTPLYSSDEYFCSCRGECLKPQGLPEDYASPPCHVEDNTLVVGPAGHCRKCLHTFASLGDVRELF